MRQRGFLIAILCTAVASTGVIGCGSGSRSQQAAETSNPVFKEMRMPAEVVPHFEQGELARAIEVLTSLIAKSPKDESLYALRANARHRIGQHADALKDLDQAIALNDHDARLYNNRGYIRMGLEQFDAALQDFDRATKLSPKYMNAYNNRGLLRIAQKRYPDAIEQFNQAIQIDPQYVDAYNNRGFAEFEAGQFEQALADFNLAIQLNSEYVNAFNNRGLLRARAGDYTNAIVDFTQAMMLDPLNPKYYEHRSEVYRRQGSMDKALADEKKVAWLVEFHHLTSAVAAAVHPVDELTDRAKHLIQVNYLDKALVDLDRALSLDSQSAEALVTRASVYLQQKSIENAKSDAQAALAIEPSQQAYSILGDVYLSLRDFDHAIENFAYARRVDPNVAAAYYGKSKLLKTEGHVEQAKETLEQALALDPDIESRLR